MQLKHIGALREKPQGVFMPGVINRHRLNPQYDFLMTTASSYSALVQELYVAYFGRPADAAGLVNFENALLAASAPTDVASLANAYGTNAAVKNLIDSFGNSAESAKLFGTVDSNLTSAEAFVTAVFEHVLNRAPAAAGLQFWANAILTGSLSVGNAALSIAVGAQTNATPQGLLDAQTIANKLTVAAEFTAAVGDSSGLNEYKGSAAATVARTLLAGVDNATNTSAYAANVQSAVISLLGTGAPYTLTTGVDNLTGTTSNNLFNAVLDNAAGISAGGTAATLNTGDTLVGGSGVNVLNINDEAVGASLAIPKGLNLTNITDLTITSAESIGVQDFSSWSGLNAVVVSKSSGSTAVTLGSSTKLSLTDTGAAGSISTNGGASVSIQTDVAHSVSVKGGTATTAVSVSGGSNVQIVDGNYGTTAANSIASVIANNSTGSVTIESMALTSLSLTADKGAVQLLTTAGNSLALALNGDTGLTISENTQSLALATSGTASTGIDLEAASSSKIALFLGANLALTHLTAPGASSLTVAGSSNLSADLSNLGANAVIDASKSSGAITATIGQQESFAGGSGQVQLTTTSGAIGTLDGGSAANNSINFRGVVLASNAVLSAVKDFATWDISGASSGTFNLSNVTGEQAVNVQGLGGNLTISHIAATVPVTIDLAGPTTYGVTLATADKTGASDAVTVNLGSTADAAQDIAQLTLQDSAGNGIGSLSMASNSSGSAPNVVTSLTDADLHSLTLSGNTAVDFASTLTSAATSLVIANSAGKAASTLAGINDSSLSGIAISGSEAVQINALASSSTTVALSDSGTGAATVNAINDSAMTNLVLSSSNGAVVTVLDTAASGVHSLSLTGSIAATVTGDTVNSGITVTGSTDNSAVVFTSSGATASGATDVVTLGSGSDQVTLGAGVAGSTQNVTLGAGANDSVTSATSGKLSVTLGASGTDTVTASGNGANIAIAGGNGHNHLSLAGSGDTVSISVGTGINTISTGTAASGAVSFASHAASVADTLQVGAFSQSGGAAAITVVAATTGVPAHLAGSLVVTGMNATGADVIDFGTTISAVEQLTATEVQSAGANTSTLAGWIAAATGQNGVVPQGAGEVVWFQQGGNTYVIQTAAASDAGVLKGTDTVVELSGTSYSFGSSSIGSSGALLLNGGSGGSGSATFTLTTGTDTFTGTAATNTFNATLGSGATLNAGDTLAGGPGGSVNILNITDSATGGTTTIPGGAAISGMTVLNIQSAEAVSGNYASWSNLGALNVTASVGTDNITAGSNTNVNIVEAGTTADVTGGKAVLVKDVNYGTATANTLATVALANLTGAATVDSNALTSLSLSGTGFNATVSAAAGTRTLGLTLAGAGSDTITDATATTVNINAATSASSQANFSFAAATSIAITDTAGLNDSQTPWTAAPAISAANATNLTVSGAGLFAANLSGLNAAATVDASATSGTVDVALSAGQSFTGGSGTAVIAVTGTPTGTIDAGTAVGNEILLVNDTAATISALAHVSHINTLGVSGTTSGTFDLSQYASGSSVHSFDVNQDTASAAITFTNAATGSALTIEGSFGNNITLQTADGNGATDSTVVTLGSTGGSTITVNTVTLEDSSFIGTATVNIDALSSASISTLMDSNVKLINLFGAATTLGTVHTFSSALTVSNSDATATITSLSDNLLSTLTLDGAADEHFGTISSTSTALTFDDNNTAAVVVGTLNDSQLTSLTLQNSVNTSDGTFTVNSMLTAPLTTLTLNGNVAFSATDTATPTGATGITVAGSTDNAAAYVSISYATPSGTTDSITLGNGGDTVAFGGGQSGSIHSTTLGTGADTVADYTAGTSNISVTGASGTAENVSANLANNVSFTLGDGNNTASALAATTVSISAGNGSNSITATAAGASGSITVGSGANTIAIGATGAMSITLGSHTGIDAITVGANADNSAISQISGIQAGDTIRFSADGAAGSSSVVAITAGEVTGDTSVLADWVSASLANLAQHQVGTFTFGGNTYLVEQSATGNAQTLTGDTVVELIGTHNEVAAIFANHVLTIA